MKAGLCGCGCGQKTRIATRTQRDRGHVKGQPMRYVHGHAGARVNRNALAALAREERRRAETAPASRRALAVEVTPEPPTPTEEYLDQLAHLSALVVGAVHDEAPAVSQARIRVALALPAPTGVDPVTALITVLAAQVDPETTTGERLGWTRSLTGPRPPALPRAAQPPDRGAA